MTRRRGRGGMIRPMKPAPVAAAAGGGDDVPSDCSEWSYDDEWYCLNFTADGSPPMVPDTDESHTYRHYDFVPMGCGAQWYSGKVGNINELLLVPGEYWQAKAASGTLEFRKYSGASPAGVYEVHDPGTYSNPALTVTEGACS